MRLPGKTNSLRVVRWGILDTSELLRGSELAMVVLKQMLDNVLLPLSPSMYVIEDEITAVLRYPLK